MVVRFRLFFFFQAEDGIRDIGVTGVQTCALPIFIDEIHRLNRQIEEVLYPAMEDFAMDIVLGQGPSARTIRMDVPRFTLVGATTRTGLMTKPLLDRFGFSSRLDYYSAADLKKIVIRNAAILKVSITDGGAHQISGRSRGTPR